MRNILEQMLKSLNIPRNERGKGKDLCKNCKCVGLVYKTASHHYHHPGHRELQDEKGYSLRFAVISSHYIHHKSSATLTEPGCSSLTFKNFVIFLSIP